ncbi:MAG: RNA pseudouridine synthase, partial [Acidobacteria bacterium]|nr:RNA pseudouridine synthase [Acidobacteriota bacterium]
AQGRFAALSKPAGRAVHGPGGLLLDIRAELGPEVELVHRLDRLTSGVLLVALSKEALAVAHAAWRSNVEKTYLAKTRGLPDPPEGEVALPLLENRTGKPKLLSRALRAAYGEKKAARLLAGQRLTGIPPLPPPGGTVAHPAGRPALTRYRVREDGLVELSPREGRMHQVRVHLAALGTPLANDPRYDPRREEPGPAPFLQLARVVWRDPPDGSPSWTWEMMPP